MRSEARWIAVGLVGAAAVGGHRLWSSTTSAPVSASAPRIEPPVTATLEADTVWSLGTVGDLRSGRVALSATDGVAFLVHDSDIARYWRYRERRTKDDSGRDQRNAPACGARPVDSYSAIRR